MKTTQILGVASCFLLVPGSSAYILPERRWTVGQPVNTNSGLVHGHSSSKAPGVSEYLGIPYAQPPVENLRWAAPQPYIGNGSINGSSYGFSCPISLAAQAEAIPYDNALINFTAAGFYFENNTAENGYAFSEDCLTLNVWTKPQTGDKEKAVLMWFYGGGFTSGSTSIPFYDGSTFADEEDVIVVTVNYRVSIFGFPGIEGASNLGLLDQRLAVEWVRDNIASFGGSPSRITIFGQSAGAQSADLYSYAYPDDPIAAGFIYQSGTASQQVQNSSIAASAWDSAVHTVICQSSNFTAELACMRQIPVDQLAAAATGAFNPTIDDVTIFSDYAERMAAGNFTKKPLLLGSNDDEGTYLTITYALSNISLPSAYADLVTASLFTCPISARASAHISQNLPTWRYRYFGSFPNTNLTTTFDAGAYHAAEIPVLWGTAPEGDGVPEYTSEELAFAKYMRGGWAAFAKDPEKGLSGYGWPMYDDSTESLVRLAWNNSVGTNAVAPSVYDGVCGSG